RGCTSPRLSHRVVAWRHSVSTANAGLHEPPSSTKPQPFRANCCCCCPMLSVINHEMIRPSVYRTKVEGLAQIDTRACRDSASRGDLRSGPAAIGFFRRPINGFYMLMTALMTSDINAPSGG
uniref:ADP,ATP carrier protein n=1 Tax=Macrostomum lignano TaxID=282301 RepID=A0A1I8FLN4_9PLAT